MTWGILAPDTVISQRRQQNLGLAAAVRHFNDRAVPGLGGMWFPMPVLWSVLAVSIAEELKHPALPIGNAIEALAMQQAKDGPTDRRVRGKRKLQGLNDWSFQSLTRRGTYVVQPIRMAMVQPLVALGFVEGSRYGAFKIHTAGKRMLELPVMQRYRHILLAWAKGENPRGLSEVVAGLSATGEVRSEFRKLILARLVDGDDAASIRRRNLVALATGPSAAQLESPLPLRSIEPDHWSDLRGGAAFMDLRDAALSVLDQLEQQLLRRRDANEPVRLSAEEAQKAAAEQLDALYQIASRQGERITASGESISNEFLSEINDLRAAGLVRALAERDGTVICWRGGHLCLGAAAGEIKVSPDAEEESHPATQNDAFAPQLFRLYNLHCLVSELKGKPNPGSRDSRDLEAA
ncbi:hypothetical protein [Devosia sp. RR2S18]|uniref:hypothetical protein n=1 Tax=Devosia rhizosphaerae TaxID=3049774 RepID=UPI0025418824|nr:hypothetical protein [Devosia sp. RR2S18]WIJ25790.1 hypothetical protein QOV41_03235 [Devosia sp. RR2S18]